MATADLSAVLASVVDGAGESVGEPHAVRESGELIVECLVSDLVNQASVLERGARLGGNSGEAVKEIGRRVESV